MHRLHAFASYVYRTHADVGSRQGASERRVDDGEDGERDRDLCIDELKAERALLHGRVKALQHQLQISKYKPPGTP